MGNDEKELEEEPEMSSALSEEEEYAELGLEDLLLAILDDIDKQIAACGTEMEETLNVVKSIMEMVYKDLEPGEVPPELANPQKFRMLLANLSKGLGKAIDYVVRVEKARKKLGEYLPYDEVLAQTIATSGEPAEERQPKEPQTPVNVNVSSTPQSTPVVKPGFFWARAEIKKAQIWAEIERMRMAEQPIVTTKKITDVVEFGRQLLPAINKLKRRIPGAVAHIKVFKNDQLYFLLHEEFATYCDQVFGALVAFVGACIEYRKNLLQGRKLGMARAIARIAEAQSYSPKIMTGATVAQRGFKVDGKGFRAK